MKKKDKVELLFNILMIIIVFSNWGYLIYLAKNAEEHYKTIGEIPVKIFFSIIFFLILCIYWSVRALFENIEKKINQNNKYRTEQLDNISKKIDLYNKVNREIFNERMPRKTDESINIIKKLFNPIYNKE